MRGNSTDKSMIASPPEMFYIPARLNKHGSAGNWQHQNLANVHQFLCTCRVSAKKNDIGEKLALFAIVLCQEVGCVCILVVKKHRKLSKLGQHAVTTNTQRSGHHSDKEGSRQSEELMTA